MTTPTSHITPDATATTTATATLRHEIESLKELLLMRIEGIEKSITVAHEDMVRVPTEVQKQVGNLKELLESKLETDRILKEEQFTKVGQRFDLLDKARIEQKADSALALNAALQSARDLYNEQTASSKEAIAKIETSTDRRFDSVALLINQNQKAADEKQQDLKERLDRTEGRGTGFSIGWSILVGAVGLVATLLVIFFSLTRH